MIETQRLTLGVEEEFHLVDLRTRRLTPRAGEVLARLSEQSNRTYAAELQQTVVETNSEVTTSLSALRANLVALRKEVSDTAESLGMGLASAGTIPLTVPDVSITETPRFRRMLADYQLLVREQLICGMQVHVGIANRDVATRLLDRISPWTPALLALSASSPFSHRGEDTGYASSRSLIWARWPTTGCAGPLPDAEAYDAMIRDLVASGVISDRAMAYFDVRPSSHVPTIELRVCDACPRVDTVVLVAGLFRAVVTRELDRLERGEPSGALAPALQRAAAWRAARSGLEGELVDPTLPHPVPARVLIRGMVQELRPELEASGDWETIDELSEATLAQGSSAAQQRAALARRGRTTDVVDRIIAETADRAYEPRGDWHAPSALSHYEVRGYDEALLPTLRARPSHASVIETLCQMKQSSLAEREQALKVAKDDAGVSFRPSGADGPTSFPIDMVPRVITAEEWSRLEGGSEQRARALDAFLRDVYGENRAGHDDIVPQWLIERCPGYRQEAKELGRDVRRAHVCGFDIVRDGDGRWLVLEDNVRVPSGIAYTIENRRLTREVLPELLSSMDLLDPNDAIALLRTTLLESSPTSAADTPSLALLSDGPSDSAFFEHRLLAERMEIPLVQPSDLYVEDDVLYNASLDERARVDVVYLRMDDRLGSRRGADGALIQPRLLAACRAGNLTLANGIGNGVADDKAIYAFVPQLIEYYLGERPLLDQVPTFHCADPEQLGFVLRHLDELVVKPVDGYGGLGVVIGPKAKDGELWRTRAMIERDPSRWIAQEMVALSTHPSLADGELQPRHVDLRVFVYHGSEVRAAPAALTRVAPAGSCIVNSSRGGGAKDTWIVR